MRIPLFRGALLLAVVGAGCAVEPAISEIDLAASSKHKAIVKFRTLLVTGTGAGSRLALRLRTSAVLDVDVGDDGSADFSFDRSTFDRVIIDAGGGDDIVRMDEGPGAFTNEEQITIIGGPGNDTLLGGIGDESFFGGAGDDTVDGGRGIDTAFLGDGNDTFVWDPGDGSDVVEGEDGTDVLVFNGSAANEGIDLSADGSRLRLFRDVAAVTMDTGGIERVDLHARGGADRVVVGDLTGTSAAQVSVDLAAFAGSETGDAQADVVIVNGTAAPDTIDVAGGGGAVVATGPAAKVSVTNGEPTLDRLVVNAGEGDLVNVNGSAAADTMLLIDGPDAPLVLVTGFNVAVAATGLGTLAVNGLGGDDTIQALPPITAPLHLDGGDGNDVVLGGFGPDVLFGGPGNDTVAGGRGFDTALLGDGDDTFVWDPGDSNDVVEGEDGTDVLLFNGSAANEGIDLSANGSRLRLFRDVAAVTMDLDGIERVDLPVRSGADRVVVGDLTGTSAARVNIDLAAFTGSGTGDAQSDVVIVNGAAGLDTIDVAADGGAVVAAGLAAKVSVTNGELTLDRMVVNAGEGDQVNVNGSAAADTMLLIDGPDAPLVQVTGFNVMVAATGLGKLAVNGLGGDDTIQAFPPITAPLHLDGGDGNDVVLGGFGPDVLLGGPGNDTVAGSRGLDTAFLGEGDDTFLWDPGDSNDVVEGEDGTDVLAFHGSAANEDLDIGANGSRLRLFRNVAAITMDVDGIERVDLDARGGADRVVVGDLTGTSVAQVNIDLAAFPGSETGDAQLDAISVLGSPSPDQIAIAADAGAVVVSGLAAAVRIAHPDMSDQLIVNGLGGVDVITSGPGVEGLVQLIINQD